MDDSQSLPVETLLRVISQQNTLRGKEFNKRMSIGVSWIQLGGRLLGMYGEAEISLLGKGCFPW